MPAEATGLPFQEAIDFVRGKVNLPTQRWDDLRHGAHARAFSVAGVVRDDMLADFRAAIEKARTGEENLADFRKRFDAIVDSTGWKFNAIGDTEEERRAWRARIIYTTNMRTSYMAGRYKQMTDPDVVRYRPWWRYKHSGSLHPRKSHLALDGRVFRCDNPIWDVYFPQNGWGCNCDVEALTDRDMRRLGKTGEDELPEGWAPYQEQDPRTGETITRWPGVDRGWEYNVGRSWQDGLVPAELREPLPPFVPSLKPKPEPNLPPMPPATPVATADLLPAGLPAQDYAKSFLDEFGLKPGESKLHRDATGGLITINEKLVAPEENSEPLDQPTPKVDAGSFMRLTARTLQDPDEVWVNWHQTPSGAPMLLRSYLRRFLINGSLPAFVRFDWSPKGWKAVTGYGEGRSQILGRRLGALLFRRKS